MSAEIAASIERLIWLSASWRAQISTPSLYCVVDQFHRFFPELYFDRSGNNLRSDCPFPIGETI